MRSCATASRSALEEHYAVDVEDAHGLPLGAARSVAVDGVTLFEDVVYDPVGVALTVRLDGRTHLLHASPFATGGATTPPSWPVGRD